MNNRAIMWAVVAVLVVGGLGFLLLQSMQGGRQELTGNLDNNQETESVSPTEGASGATGTAGVSRISVTLDEQNDSGESGTAILTEGADGMVRVSLSVTAASVGTAQPAHIHAGACPNPGAIKYPLTSVINGVSETTLNVGMATLRSQLPLAINVHKSAAETQVYVACGDVTL